MIKIILTFFLIITLFYFIQNPSSTHVRAWKRILFVLFLFLGIFSVLFPDILNKAANLIGIGRGADLLLYSLALVFFFSAINVYLKFKEMDLRINKIVSELAILEKEKKDE